MLQLKPGELVQVRDLRDGELAINKGIYRGPTKDGDGSYVLVECDESEPHIGGMTIGVPLRCVERLPSSAAVQ